MFLEGQKTLTHSGDFVSPLAQADLPVYSMFPPQLEQCGGCLLIARLGS